MAVGAGDSPFSSGFGHSGACVGASLGVLGFFLGFAFSGFLRVLMCLRLLTLLAPLAPFLAEIKFDAEPFFGFRSFGGAGLPEFFPPFSGFPRKLFRETLIAFSVLLTRSRIALRFASALLGYSFRRGVFAFSSAAGGFPFFFGLMLVLATFPPACFGLCGRLPVFPFFPLPCDAKDFFVGTAFPGFFLDCFGSRFLLRTLARISFFRGVVIPPLSSKASFACRSPGVRCCLSMSSFSDAAPS